MDLYKRRIQSAFSLPARLVANKQNLQKAEDYYSPAYFLALLATIILVAESLEAY